MASLSPPAAMRSTKVSSEEYSPAVAAIAGTAAAADPAEYTSDACDFPYSLPDQPRRTKFTELFLWEPWNRHVFSKLKMLFGRFVRGRQVRVSNGVMAFWRNGA